MQAAGVDSVIEPLQWRAEIAAPSSRRSRRSWLGALRVLPPLARWTLAILGTVIAGLYAQGSAEFVPHATTSDALLPVSFAWNLFHQPGTIGSFQLPRIPSIAPDLVTIVSLDYLTGGDARRVMFAYSFLQAIATTALAAAVIARLAKVSSSHAALAWVSLLAVVIAVSDLRVLDLVALYLPVEHFSTFLFSLLGLLLALRYLDRGRRSAALWLCALVGIAELSSQKFLVDFVLPELGAAAVMVRLGHLAWRRAASLAGWTVLGLVIGRLADRLLVRQPDLGMVQVLVHARTFAIEAVGYFQQRPLICLVCLVLPLIIALFAIVSWLRLRLTERRIVLSPDDATVFYAGCFGVLAWWGSVAAMALVYVDVGSYRYTAPALCWPLLFSAAVLAHLCRNRFGASSVLQAAIMLAMLASRPAAAIAPPLLSWQHPLVKCLEDAGLSEGLADYWNARSPTVASGFRLQIDQIDGGGLYVWGNNRQWYSHAFADPARAPDYNFIVTTRLDEASLRARFGAPQSRVQCGDDQVWLYPEDANLRAALTRPLTPSAAPGRR
ncbi:hypothetical protein JQ604_11645 [Bradyrhizobium jicamae]|uniref:hypothetical protein n=1 Tax=Bradyrhizobium jicamae TaxID=280332 RepID=UPI001BAC7C74|nr:hypothetical protein [Bradyrhizobium jicamae]MBR0752839.1 hypothetical protein [Bradyrhizobium jicamae]